MSETISTAIRLQDQMTPVLRQMVSAMNLSITAMEHMERSSKNMIHRPSIEAARRAIGQAGLSITGLTSETMRATRAQNQFNHEAMKTKTILSGLKGKVVSLFAGYSAFQGGRHFVNASDQMAQMKARIDLINDGNQTTAQLQNLIFESAERARGSYTGMSDAVGKMGLMAGNVFKNNQELIGFTEQMQKHFKVAGTGQAQIESATLQMTQAMASGALRGEELNAVFDAAPTMIQAITKYMNQPIGQVKKLASEGLITSQIVKNAMLLAADETDRRLKQIPRTWGDTMESINSQMKRSMESSMVMFSHLINSQAFIDSVNTVMRGVELLIKGATFIGHAFIWAADAARSHWNMVGPIFYTLSAILGVLLLAKIWAVTSGFVAARIAAIKAGAAMVAKFTLAHWPLLLISAAVAGIVFLLMKMGVTAQQMFEFMGGVAFTAGALIQNVFIGLANDAIWATNGILRASTWLYNQARMLLGLYLKYFAEAMLKAPRAVDDFCNKAMRSFAWFVNGALDGVQNLLDKFKEMTRIQVPEWMGGGTLFQGIDLNITAKRWTPKPIDRSTWEDLAEKAESILEPIVAPQFEALKYQDYGQAWDQGKAFGGAAFSSIKNLLNGAQEALKAPPGFDVKGLGDALSRADKKKKGKGKSGKSRNVKAIKDKLDTMGKDLSAFRDLAVVKATNRIGLGDVKLIIQNEFNHQGQDLHGYAGTVADTLRDQIARETEGGLLQGV